MNDEELEVIFPNRDQILPESKDLVKTYRNLMSEMANTQDQDIVKIGHFYPLWIVDLCQRATHSITAFIEEKDLPVYRFLQQKLSSMDLDVHLMIEAKPQNYQNMDFASYMYDMKRLQICPQKICMQNILVVDDTHFLIKRYDENQKKQYMGAFHQPKLAQQIKTYLMAHWNNEPMLVTSRYYAPDQHEGYTK